MQIQTIYCAAKYNNVYFFDLYPKYQNGDIVLYMGSNQFYSYSEAVNDAVSGYQSFVSHIQGIENITLIGDDNVVQENNLTFLKKVLLNINIPQPSDNPDYTNVLSNINSNLTLLNTNITNKNNQSDIVDCLKLIFINRISGVESSVMKVNTNNDNIKQNSSIPLLLSRIAQFLSSDPNFTWGSSNDVQYRVLTNISRKIFDINPSNINNASVSQSDLCSRLYYLIQSLMSATSNTTANIISNSLLKQISEKLANSNDLHTISQAIDLISTAIAQTPTTDVSGLTSAVQNLKLEQNNLIQVEGDIDYRIKYDKDKEE